MSGPPTGARIGPALAQLMAHARVIAHDHTSRRDQQLREQSTARLMEGVETHLAPHAMAMFAELRDAGALPEGLAALLDQAQAPGAQFDAIFEVLLVMVSLIFQAGALTQPIMQRYVNSIWTQRTDVPITADEVALSILRGFLAQGEGETIAAMTGYNATALQHKIDNTGEPPAIEQLLLLFRRNEIDRARLVRGIKESRVRDEWIDDVVNLRYGPPPAAEAVAAAVQGHLSNAESQAKLGEAGINPDNWQWLYDTHGRPPGTAEMGQLVNRGYATEAEWAQAIRESDIKNKYIPAILHLREYLPPVRSIPTMLRSGSITPERAAAILRAHGVLEQDVPIYLHEGSSTKLAAHKEIALGEIKLALTDDYVTEAEAAPLIAALGYDAHEVTFLLGLAQHAREIKLRDQGVARVHARYIAYRIDRPTAGTALDTLHIAPDARDSLLATWDVEVEISRPRLTLTQLAKAHKAGAITDDDYTNRLTEYGYTPADVAILFGIL